MSSNLFEQTLNTCQATYASYLHLYLTDHLNVCFQFLIKENFRITIGIGDPIETEELLAECRRLNYSELATRKYITDVVELKLDKLCRRINDIHYKD